MGATPNPFRPVVRVLLTALLAGLALWFSRAAFDVAGSAAEPMRVAMLPSLPELAGLVVLMLLAATTGAALLGWDSLSDASTPALALSALGLPYLPWLADWVPSLRLLSGPISMLLWFTVIGQVICLRWRPLRELPGAFSSSLIVFAVSLSVYVWAGYQRDGMFDPLPVRLVAAAAVAAVIWLGCFGLTGSRAAATFAWASTCLTLPYVLNARELVPGAVVDLVTTLRQFRPSDFEAIASGVTGVLVDQEFGLVPYAPILLVGLVGLGPLIRDRARRRLGVALVVATLAVVVLAGALDPWWSDAMMPGKTVLILLPLLAPPLAYVYLKSSDRPAPRIWLQTVLVLSLALTASLVRSSLDVPLPQQGDGSSSLLQWLAPTWQLWNDAPSFTDGVSARAMARAGLWLSAFALTWLVISKLKATPGRTALAATTALLMVFVGGSAVAASLVRETASRFDPEGRVMFPLLESFSPVARPIAIRYDPISMVNPMDLPRVFSLTATPGQRRDRQPVRVLLNARLRLPAGEYEVEVTGSDKATSDKPNVIGLQLGREGRAVETWKATLEPGSTQSFRVVLPLAAEFVGLRGSREVEQAVESIRWRVLSVQPVSLRHRAPTVLSAADFGVARVFFHDSGAYAERDGFWLRGRSTVRMTLVKSHDAAESLTLAVHSGERANAATFSAPGWEGRLDLAPGVTQRIVVPARPGEHLAPLSISTADGFVPAVTTPGNRDRRLLGVWVAFIPDDTSRTSEAP
jgi:hypothetical protein